jgi:hypothetical protein
MYFKLSNSLTVLVNYAYHMITLVQVSFTWDITPLRATNLIPRILKLTKIPRRQILPIKGYTSAIWKCSCSDQPKHLGGTRKSHLWWSSISCHRQNCEMQVYSHDCNGGTLCNKSPTFFILLGMGAQYHQSPTKYFQNRRRKSKKGDRAIDWKRFKNYLQYLSTHTNFQNLSWIFLKRAR